MCLWGMRLLAGSLWGKCVCVLSSRALLKMFESFFLACHPGAEGDRI